MKLKQKNVVFLKHSINFLGQASSKGIKTNPEKTRAVLECPNPANNSELHSFLRLASYYHRYIANFASKSEPLCYLLQQNKQFEWTDQQQKAFSYQIKCLANSCISELWTKSKRIRFRYQCKYGHRNRSRSLTNTSRWYWKSYNLWKPFLTTNWKELLCHTPRNLGSCQLQGAFPILFARKKVQNTSWSSCPKMTAVAAVNDYCASFQTCAACKPPSSKLEAPLQSIPSKHPM